MAFEIDCAAKEGPTLKEKHVKIAEAAASLFVEKGFHNTSIREIAKACGMSMGNLYHYIKSKDDVLFLVYQEVYWNWEENLKEIENKTLIYFPYNSTDKLDNDNISTYLSSVADALKGNDKTVTLTGHTDNIGNPPFNKKLAMLRAIAMKKLLVSSGVDASRITLVSEGQAKPIASNDTEEGRQKNRRVELEIK